MAPSIQELGLDQLSVAERILLAEAIWDSIAEEAEAIPLPDSQGRELERRGAEYVANPRAGASWELIKGRLRASM